tara:strand:+ start:10103 stop:11023 length:921 start_codon:yes stop_codon:yes gene_type:complete
MFLKNFKKTSPFSIVFFIIFSVVFCLIPILNNPIDEIYHHSFFSSITVFVLSFFLPLFQSVGLNNLTYEKDVIKKNNLVLAPIFLLLGTPYISNLDGWIISFILLFYLNTLFSSYQKDRPFSQSFNANFILGSIGIFYSEILLLFPLIIVVLLTFSNLSLRSFIISLMGLLIPLLFYKIYTSLFGIEFSLDFPMYSFSLPIIPSIKNMPYAEIIWYSLLILIILFSFIELFFWLYKKSIRSRKSYIITLSYLLILTFVDLNDSYYLFLSPIAIIAANFFVYSKRTLLTEVLFFLFIVSSIFYRTSI